MVAKAESAEGDPSTRRLSCQPHTLEEKAKLAVLVEVGARVETAVGVKVASPVPEEAPAGACC